MVLVRQWKFTLLTWRRLGSYYFHKESIGQIWFTESLTVRDLPIPPVSHLTSRARSGRPESLPPSAPYPWFNAPLANYGLFKLKLSHGRTGVRFYSIRLGDIIAGLMIDGYDKQRLCLTFIDIAQYVFVSFN